MQQMGQDRIQLQSPGGWTEDSASAMTRQTFQAIVMQALQLRPIYREVFILCDIKGYSTSEAAAILAISEAAVTRRLRRARGLMALQSSTSTDS
jgi:DNA-directed RNA polymerase specialized sigma24 family protein